MAFYKGQPDIIIRNGTIVDGTGKMPYYADIAVKGDRIDYIGNLKDVKAPLEIDAHHKYVTNGFIDSHSHSDRTVWAAPECLNAVSQGVSTEIVGNCGSSMYTPLAPDDFDPAGDGIDCAYNLQGPEYPKGCMAATLDKAEKMGVGVNMAWLCGHNDLRIMADCYGPEPTVEQYKVMEDFIDEAMQAGYIGFSTGLEFLPGIISAPQEVERLASIAAKYDANYCTHMRDEGTYIFEAVNEFLNVIRKTGMRGTISHLNVKYDNGVPNEYLQKCIQMLKDAREIEHLNVMCDMLSTTFATGRAMALLPPWLYEESWKKAQETLADPAGREKVKNDFCRYWRFLDNGQWDRMLYVQADYLPEVTSMTFQDIVKKAGKDPIDVFLDIMQAAPTLEAANSVHIQGKVFFEQQLIDSVVTDPIYMWQTDSTVTSETGHISKITTNVQNYMSMSYFFIRYVRDLRVISIQDACKKVGMTPAHHFRLEKRGTLEIGNYADINVFDLNALKINATFADPCKYSTGMDYVIINGVPVIANGEIQHQHAGRVLRHLGHQNIHPL